MVSGQLPKYRQRRSVYALQIREVVLLGDWYYIVPVDNRFDQIAVPLKYIEEYGPQPGDWYIVNGDHLSCMGDVPFNQEYEPA